VQRHGGDRSCLERTAEKNIQAEGDEDSDRDDRDCRGQKRHHKYKPRAAATGKSSTGMTIGNASR
jgi:hypothetical protein